MADAIITTLESIDTRMGFTVFEEHQVLTHDHLNELGRYLDAQERLTRVATIGVGVVCGLRPSLVDGRIRLTKGVGVTTDGDLFRFGAETMFDRWRDYPTASSPAYGPFGTAAAGLRLFELVKVDATGPDAVDARALSAFADPSRPALDSLVAVLFMESYEHDPDLCTGPDCDNLGKDSIHKVRVLLVDAAGANQLRPPAPARLPPIFRPLPVDRLAEAAIIARPRLPLVPVVIPRAFDTPDGAARALDAITIARPLLNKEQDTPSQIASSYLGACRDLVGALAGALSKLHLVCQTFLKDVFPEDPAPAWRSVLDGLQARFEVSARGVQYYYDFLVDLAETYTDFRAQLFGDTAICAPDVGGFPKHLLLGSLSPSADRAANRMDFYPSPAVAGGFEKRRHARFLARKLDTLIFTFELPAGPIEVRVTPSQREDRPLEERAIPHYYKVNETKPIYRAWNHRLERSGMSQSNYSYNAGLYSGPMEPLKARIASFSFFRVEGHLGRPVQEALAAINAQIKACNLPFTARAVMLDPDVTKLPPFLKPPFRFTDLHRIHRLIRHDVASQLGEASDFSGSVKMKVDAAATTVVSEESGLRNVALQKTAAVQAKSSRAITKLTQPFQAYRADVSWRTDVSETVETAAQYKSDLGDVVRTEFSSPFDNLIGSTHLQWLPWLDDIIKKKDEKADTKVLFATFLGEHPGLDHRAGAPAGGTLVLAHDTAGVVVADFALPYYAPAPVEEVEDEPPLPRPPDLRPPIIIDRPITILPPRKKFFDDEIAKKFTEFRGTILPEFDKITESNKKYFDGLKDSLGIIGGRFTPSSPAVTLPGSLATDLNLDSTLRITRARSEVVDGLRNLRSQPTNNAARNAELDTQIRAAEEAVARSIADTAAVVARDTTPLSPGTTDAVAGTVNEAMNRITPGNTAAVDTVRTGLDSARVAATTPENRTVLTNIRMNRIGPIR
jgi:hypothetical protein